jgi:peroxiredoxin (alkyl hydroperoxide reductase subunit C)
MPLDWKKGDKVIIPPPKTLAEMEAREADDSIEKIDFYLAKKNLN